MGIQDHCVVIIRVQWHNKWSLVFSIFVCIWLFAVVMSVTKMFCFDLKYKIYIFEADAFEI